MRQRSSEDPSSFPNWVALASLVFVLALFFTNTVPALREQQSLGDVRTELIDLRRQYEDAIRLAVLGSGPRHDYDLQSLLVAIDEQGYTPLELCVAHPERPIGPPGPGQREVWPEEGQPGATPGNADDPR